MKLVRFNGLELLARELIPWRDLFSDGIYEPNLQITHELLKLCQLTGTNLLII